MGDFRDTFSVKESKKEWILANVFLLRIHSFIIYYPGIAMSGQLRISSLISVS